MRSGKSSRNTSSDSRVQLRATSQEMRVRVRSRSGTLDRSRSDMVDVEWDAASFPMSATDFVAADTLRWDGIGRDVFSVICSFLPSEDLSSVSLVCRSWHAMIRNQRPERRARVARARAEERRRRLLAIQLRVWASVGLIMLLVGSLCLVAVLPLLASGWVVFPPALSADRPATIAYSCIIELPAQIKVVRSAVVCRNGGDGYRAAVAVNGTFVGLIREMDFCSASSPDQAVMQMETYLGQGTVFSCVSKAGLAGLPKFEALPASSDDLRFETVRENALYLGELSYAKRYERAVSLLVSGSVCSVVGLALVIAYCCLPKRYKVLKRWCVWR